LSAKQSKVISKQTAYAAYQGPLPPAAQFQQYDTILPGAAERILATYEKQLEHRHDIEKRYVKASCCNSTLGVIMGFILSLFTIAMSGYLIYLGNATAGSVLGVASIGSLAGVFVYGTKMKSK
jgi:uncharacterized membrane protein